MNKGVETLRSKQWSLCCPDSTGCLMFWWSEDPPPGSAGRPQPSTFPPGGCAATDSRWDLGGLSAESGLKLRP